VVPVDGFELEGRLPVTTARVHSVEASPATDFVSVARPNRSLSRAGRALFLASIFAVSMGIAAAFAAFGAWPILPFAGIEMLALGLAFLYLERRSGDYERLAVEGDLIVLERCEAGVTSRHEMNRLWARLVEREGARLALRYGGRELEIGRFLDEAQRAALARGLARHVRVAR
jgi:uncharacterized membrane protein